MKQNVLYISPYYECTKTYIRYGNIFLSPYEEKFFYITEQAIPGIPEFRYAISNCLNVYDFKEQKPANITIASNGYYSVHLFNNIKNKKVTYMLHRVYMLVFCYFNGCEIFEVNHIDGNKLNDHPANLEWLSHKDNMAHASFYIKNKKLSDQDIIDIIYLYNQGLSISDIAKRFSVTSSFICDIINGGCGINHNGDIDRFALIKEFYPITREKPKSSVLVTDIAKLADEYNSGAEYYQLAEKYNVDRSSLTKAIKRYAKTHPEIELRKLKIFSDSDVYTICKILEENKTSALIDICRICSDILKIDMSESLRSAIKNIRSRRTYTNISSKYNF